MGAEAVRRSMGQVVQRNFRHSLAGRRKERKNVGGGSHSPPVNALCFRVTKIQIGVLGHSLVCSLVRSHRSLVCLLCTAHFARALRCATPTLLTPLLMGKSMIRWLFILSFFLLLTIVRWWQSLPACQWGKRENIFELDPST